MLEKNWPEFAPNWVSLPEVWSLEKHWNNEIRETLLFVLVFPRGDSLFRPTSVTWYTVVGLLKSCFIGFLSFRLRRNIQLTLNFKTLTCNQLLKRKNCCWKLQFAYRRLFWFSLDPINYWAWLYLKIFNFLVNFKEMPIRSDWK